jgi:hypothetical protein
VSLSAIAIIRICIHFSCVKSVSADGIQRLLVLEGICHITCILARVHASSRVHLQTHRIVTDRIGSLIGFPVRSRSGSSQLKNNWDCQNRSKIRPINQIRTKMKTLGGISEFGSRYSCPSFLVSCRCPVTGYSMHLLHHIILLLPAAMRVQTRRLLRPALLKEGAA